MQYIDIKQIYVLHIKTKNIGITQKKRGVFKMEQIKKTISNSQKAVS